MRSWSLPAVVEDVSKPFEEVVRICVGRVNVVFWNVKPPTGVSASCDYEFRDGRDVEKLTAASAGSLPCHSQCMSYLLFIEA